jgi:lipoprotein signal peptidase
VAQQRDHGNLSAYRGVVVVHESAERGIGNRRRWLLIAVFAAVIGTDQAVKWWAWRHIDGTLVNAGGYILLGPVIRSWWSGSVSGAVLDVIAGVVMILGRRPLLLRCRTIGVLIGAGLVAAGWMSNLLDRLVLHYWTAPGSVRGVVDFIPSGWTSRANVADLWIVAGALLLGYSLVRRRWAGGSREEIRSHPALPHRRARVAELVAVLALVTLAVIGAINYGGVEVPPVLAAA